MLWKHESFPFTVAEMWKINQHKRKVWTHTGVLCEALLSSRKISSTSLRNQNFLLCWCLSLALPAECVVVCGDTHRSWAAVLSTAKFMRLLGDTGEKQLDFVVQWCSDSQGAESLFLMLFTCFIQRLFNSVLVKGFDSAIPGKGAVAVRFQSYSGFVRKLFIFSPLILIFLVAVWYRRDEKHLWSSLVPVQEISVFSSLGEVVFELFTASGKSTAPCPGISNQGLSQSSGGTIPAWLWEKSGSHCSAKGRTLLFQREVCFLESGKEIQAGNVLSSAICAPILAFRSNNVTDSVC